MKFTVKDILAIVGVTFDWTTLLEDSKVQIKDHVFGHSIRENAYNDGKGNYIVSEDGYNVTENDYLDIDEAQLMDLEVVSTKMRKNGGGDWIGIDVFVNIDAYRK